MMKTFSQKLKRQTAASTLMVLLWTSGCAGNGVGGEYLAQSAEFLQPPIRPVIILSGFGHAKLFDPRTGRFVWGTLHATLQTRFADNLDLSIDPDTMQVQPDRLVPRGFVGFRSPLNFAWRLGHALEKYAGYSMATLEPPDQQPPRMLYRFAYDWRLGALHNARKLDAFIDSVRRAHANPSLQVDLVGHSLGGFIALTYLKLGTASIDAPSTWEQGSTTAASKVRTLIVMAAPQQGAADAFRVMVRSERFVMRVLPPEWNAVFPALTEMLPTDGRILIDENGRAIDADLWDIRSWQRLQLSIFSPQIRQRVESRKGGPRYEDLTTAFEKELTNAYRLRQALRRALPSGVNVTTIASDCIPTTRRILRRNDGSYAFYQVELAAAEQHLSPILFEPGDGSVTLTSASAGKPESSTVFCEGHQGMVLQPNVHRAIIRALQAR